MKRFLILLVAMLMVGLFLPGCEDQGSSAAADFGAQEGQRPKPKEKRQAPGGGHFDEGEHEHDEDEGSEPPDDDD